MSIGKIKNLMVKIKLLKKEKFYMEHNNQYKCENYEIYKKDYDEVCDKLVTVRNSFIEECNNFVGYPKKKILFLDVTKKIKFKHEEYLGDLLIVPFIDKQEYFCLINLFESMIDYIKEFRKFHNTGDTEWIFK